MQPTDLPSGGGFTFGAFARWCLEHASVYYRREDGTHTREHLNIRASLDHLFRVVDPLAPAESLSRQDLRDLRQCLVGRKLSRSYVNATMARIKRCVGWAVENDLLPTSVESEFAAVKPYKKNRSPAVEHGPVRPVDPDHFAATLPKLSPLVRSVMHLLELTGARLGEILSLRNADITEAGEELGQPGLLLAIPPFHKTMHHGHRRVIPLDQRCQIVLAPWLRPLLPEQRIFRMTPSGVYHAVRRGCRSAGVPDWSPHQVRHLVATTVRQRVGLDAAAELLGHADIRSTQIYAQVQPEEAIRAQRALTVAGVTADADEGEIAMHLTGLRLVGVHQ